MGKINLDWKPYDSVKPPIGIEVLAKSKKWINSDYNKKGIRIGFQNESENGSFISAKWCNYQDHYQTIDDSNPEYWAFIS